jgi:hypothetical protein
MVVASCFLVALPAFADIVTIDFGTGSAGTGGTFTLNSPNATGTGIPIQTVTISGALTGDGTYNVAGSCTGSNGSGFGCLNFDTLNNRVQITGDIPGLSIFTSELLLKGTFVSWNASVNGLMDATGPDTKATNLLTALSLPTNQPFAYFGFSLTTSPISHNSIISTDFRNTTVPDGGFTLMLLGGVFVSIEAFRRKLRL